MSRYVFCFRLNGIKNQSSSALALRSSRKSPLQAISNPYHFAFACYVRCSLFVVCCCRCWCCCPWVSLAAFWDQRYVCFFFLYTKLWNIIVQPSALSNASITLLESRLPRNSPGILAQVLSHCTINRSGWVSRSRPHHIAFKNHVWRGMQVLYY